MSVVPFLAKTSAVMSLALALLVPGLCRADDCGPAVYAYENRVVFYSCDKTGALGFNVVVLDDSNDLKISGRVTVKPKRSFDAITHYKDQLLILTWDLLEVYDATDPAQPGLVAAFTMKNQGKFPGYGRIEKKAENTFLVLAPPGAGELTFAGNASKWAFKDVERTPSDNKLAQSLPPESALSRETQEVTPLEESAKFRYEFVWKDRKRTGQVLHREFVRKVDKATQRPVSALPVGERLETID